MKTRLFPLLLLSAAFLSANLLAARAGDSQKSFETVVYIPVAGTLKMKDPQWLESTWGTISSQLHVDKVYIETYRSRVLADDQVIEDAKKLFLDHGVKIAGAICYSDSDNGQFVSLCLYEAGRPRLREACLQVHRQALRRNHPRRLLLR